METMNFHSLSEDQKREYLLKIQSLINDNKLQEAKKLIALQENREAGIEGKYKPFALSDIQESFSVGKYFGQAFDNVGCHVYFEFAETNLDIERLNRAWNTLVEYHEMLHVVVLADRTQKVLKDFSGYAFKVYDQVGKSTMEIERHFGEIRERMSHKLYKIEEWPLFEICITKMDGESIIHFSMDEWITDGFSLSLMLRQWYSLYKNPDIKLPEFNFTFREYLKVQKENEGSARYNRDLDYWMNKYKSIPGGPSLPYRSNPVRKPGEDHFKRKRYSAVIEEGIWNKMKERANLLEVSKTALVITCFNELLAYWSKEANFSIITTYFNRPPVHHDIDKVVGPFVSTNIFSIENISSLTLEEKALYHQGKMWNDLDHSSVSGIRALREIRVREKKAPNLSIPIVFTSMLNNAGKEAQDSWLENTRYSISQTPQVCLDHQVYEHKGNLNIIWDVIEEYFEENTLERMFSEYVKLIRTIAENESAWSMTSLKSSLRVQNAAAEKGTLDMQSASLKNAGVKFQLSDLQQAHMYGRRQSNISCQVYQEFNVDNIDVPRLQRVFNHLVEVHDMLRAVIDINGYQQILGHVPEYRINITDLRGISDRIVLEENLKNLRASKMDRLFPMDKWPLFDLSVTLIDEGKARIHFSIDAILADGKSISTIYRQLFQMYKNPEMALGKPEFSYREYLEYIHRFKKSSKASEITEYWKSKCLGLPPGPSLPYVENYDGKPVHKRLEGRIEQWSSLKRKARELSIEPGVLLFTAYAEVLQKWAENVHFSTVFVDWRRQAIHPQINDIVGEFTSLSWVENRESSLTFLGKAKRNNETVKKDLENSIVSGLSHLRKRMMMGNFSLPVVFTNYLEGTESGLPADISFGFGMSFTPGVFLDNMSCEQGDSLIFNWDYDASAFQAGTVEAMFEDYKKALNYLTDNIGLLENIDLKNILTPLQKRKVASEENMTAPIGDDCHGIDYTKFKCIHELFEEQVRRHSGARAITFNGESITYDELNKRANQLANHLKKLGCGPEVLVGILLERSIEMIVAILGILKCGGAYVPLDTYYPKERLALIIEDSEIPVLITQEKYLNELTGQYNVRMVCIDRDRQKISQESGNNLNAQVKSNNIAYVIYTSGSTGKPKGALICHYNVARLFEATDHWFGFNENDVWTMFHSYAFDFSVWEIWGALLYGGRLVVVPYTLSRAFDKFYELVEQEKVTVLNQTPTAFKQFMLAEDKRLNLGNLSLRYIIFGGEALNPQSLSRWFDRHGDCKPQLINMYGITETTVHVTYRPITKKDVESKASVIGCPIPDLKLYILDEQLNRLPAGKTGELYVSGLGLARGYLKRPNLTRERFVPNPFSGIQGDRLYKTGDLGMYLPDGDIEYLGRADLQVKIRGFRIELGDIETALLTHEIIKGAIVTVQDRDTDDPKIVAYIIPEGNEIPSIKSVRHFLRSKLPDYMVPNVIVPISSFPLTENGKLDRKVLPWPIEDGMTANGFVQSPVKNAVKDMTPILVEIFKEALETPDEVTAEDDIFDLGATSLTIMTVTQTVGERYNVGIPVEVFLTTSTIKEIAQYLNSELGAVTDTTEDLEGKATAQESADSDAVVAVFEHVEEQTGRKSSEIINELVEIFREALETTDEIADEDDIFDLGATSLTIMTVTQTVGERYNVGIPVEVFLTTSDIRSIALYLWKELGGKEESFASNSSAKAEEQTSINIQTEKLEVIKIEKPDFKEDFYFKFSSKIGFKGGKVSFQDFSNFLALLKKEKVKGETKYLYPSAGGRNCIQTYVYARKDGVEGLDGGVYYYHPLKNTLIPITKNITIDKASHMEFNRKAFELSAFTVFFIAQLDALQPVYADYSKILSKVDTGYMVQLLMSRQADYNIGLYPVVGFDFESVEQYFKLKEGNMFVYSIMGGCFDYSSKTGDFNQVDVAYYISKNQIDIGKQYKQKNGYESIDEVLTIQREKKFNILSRKELVELTKRQPHIRKFEEEVEDIKLASGSMDPSHYILRSSQRHFIDKPVSHEDFRGLISLLQRIPYNSGAMKGLFTPPSGISGLKIFLYVKENGVEQLNEGVYLYNRDENSLTRVNETLSIPIRMCHTPFNLSISKEAKFFIFLVADLQGLSPVLGDASIHYAEVESGMIGQLLLDRQSEFNIGLVPIGGMDFEKIHKDFKVSLEDVYIHSFMCGPVEYELKREASFGIMANCDTSTDNQNTKKYDNENSSEQTEIVMPKEDLYYPLSYGQKSLFFVYQSEPSSSSYNTAYHVRIRERFDLEIFKRALDFVIIKNPLLRATFTIKDGNPCQVIRPEYKPEIIVIDASGWDNTKLVEENIKEYHVPFNLERNPAFRIVLFKISDNDHVLMFNIHHIITDFSSTGLMVSDLWSFYGKLLENPDYRPAIVQDLRYFEYISWQNELLSGKESETMWNYWKEALGGELPVLNLPTDKTRPAVQKFNGSTLKFTIDKELADKYREFARREKKTLYTIMLTAFNILLYRYSGQDDILVGTTANARGESRFQDVFGYFINPIVIRGDLSGEPTFKEMVERISKRVFASLSHQNYPFSLLVERLQPERDASRSPIFQVTFQLLSQSMTSKKSKMVSSIEFFEIPQQEGQFDLEMELMEEECIYGRIAYNSDLFNEETMERFKTHFMNLLREVISVPDNSISAYSMIDESERDLLVNKWNDTKVEFAGKGCIHQLFEERARKNPDQIAVVCNVENGQRKIITYGELNSKSNQLANYLRNTCRDNTKIIGICLNKSIEMIIGVMAVFKAGFAYVPIDPTYPSERKEFILKDSSITTVLTTSKLQAEFDIYKTEFVNLDKVLQKLDAYERTDLNLDISPKELAYIIYTSGSTGMPKGVKIAHEGAVNIFHGYKEAYRLENVCKIHLQMATFTFDVFVGDFIRSLCSGGRLVICPRECLIDPEKLYNLIVTEKVDFAEFVPAVMRHLVQYMERTNKTIDNMKGLVISSDSWNMKECNDFRKRFKEGTRFISAYGVTEVSIDSTYIDCDELPSDATGFVAIGRPFPNTEIYILDKKLNLAPIGVPGELCIGGKGVMMGYLNRPELTEEKLIPNKFSNEPGARIYRTGDLVRYLPNGVIEFLGRIDNQIKIRGLRVELGEIEEVLTQYQGIKESVVLARKDKSGENVLIGFYTISDNSMVSLEELQAYLKNKLPVYMVPSVFVKLDEFPLNSNGKINRNALPNVDITIKETVQQFIEPRTETERKLVEVWKSVLQLDKVGIDNNFFDIGGHSFLAIKIVDEMSKVLSQPISLSDFLMSPTIEHIAGIVDKDEPKEVKDQSFGVEEISFVGGERLNEKIVPSWFSPENIFLTGATGHLGVNLLSDLLKTYSLVKVHCLVRARSNEDGLKKIENALKNNMLWTENIMSRVVPVLGDLEKPLLGLSQDEFSELAKSVDVIFHNGALVNFVYPYSVLKRANVDGTIEVLKLAVNSKLKLVHYVSTTSVLENVEVKKRFFNKIVRIEEDAPLVYDDKLKSSMGYTQSKWVAESIITEAQSRGIPVVVYRPDIISGHSKTGIWNTTDYASRTLRNIAVSGIVPIGDVKFNWVPVDYVSRVIIKLASMPDSINKRFNLTSPHQFKLKDLGRWISSIGYPVKDVRFSEWLRIMKEKLKTQGEFEGIPGEILESAEKYNPNKIVVYDSSNTDNALKATGLECPKINLSTIEKYFTYFIETGFIQHPKK